MVGSAMPLRPDPLPQDAAQLSRIILSLDAENADLKARVAFLEQQLFGPKSEKMTTLDPTQATLDLGDLSPIPEPRRQRRLDGRHRVTSAVCPSTFRGMTRSSSRRASFARAVRSNCIASARMSARRSTSCRRLSGSNGRSGRAMPAGPAKASSCKRPRRRV